MRNCKNNRNRSKYNQPPFAQNGQAVNLGEAEQELVKAFRVSENLMIHVSVR